MERVDLNRYDVTGILGAGADYEARAAVDRETGQQVVLKRPEPQMIRRQLHAQIEARTERTVKAYETVGHRVSNVVPLLGYTDRANHDMYFGETLGETYRVMVEARAQGIPLVGDIKARFMGVPIGVGQNLFALYPLVRPAHLSPFPIQQQLLDIEEAYFQAGYILLDLQPQNVFYQPASGRITVIDCGVLIEASGDVDRRGQPQDLHNFCLEMLKFYTTPQPPPSQARAYRDPYGLRPVVHFERELEQMVQQCKGDAEAEVQAAALPMLDRIRQRAYADVDAFRRDLSAYLEAVGRAHQASPQLGERQRVWLEALEWLRADYWQRYLFHPEAELAAFAVS
jgi:hypothetical protein